MVTSETITRAQVERLQQDAADCGDTVMHEIAGIALGKWTITGTITMRDRKAIEAAIWDCVVALREGER